MATIEEQDVWIKVNDGDTACAGVFFETHYTPHDRFVRAIKALGALWGMAVLLIPVPPIHLILIPAFLIAGPVVAYRRYITSVVANHVTGACPTCKQDMKLALQPADRVPTWKYCPKCNAPVHIDAK